MDSYGHGGDVFAYESIKYDFSVNINPFGMPEAVKAAVIGHIGDFETYPDTKYRALRSAIANMEGIGADSIICGNGAADLIYKLCLSQKPKKVLVCAPAFSEYDRAALLSGAAVKYHTLYEQSSFVMTGGIMEDITDDVDMVFLCTPNNPTGRLIDIKLIEAAAEKARICGSLLILDECFLDFTSGQSAKYLLGKYPNLVILKAFTKIFAMAGLRLGYLLCSDKLLLSQVNDFGQCWSVSSAAQFAGAAACSLSGFFEKTREFIETERRFIFEGIKYLGTQAGLDIEVFDSEANFMLIKSSRPLKEQLIKKGILIRACDNFKGLDNRYYRIAVKTRDANTALLESLREVLTDG